MRSPSLSLQHPISPTPHAGLSALAWDLLADPTQTRKLELAQEIVSIRDDVEDYIAELGAGSACRSLSVIANELALLTLGLDPEAWPA
jgi:hypothetical protein